MKRIATIIAVAAFAVMSLFAPVMADDKGYDPFQSYNTNNLGPDAGAPGFSGE